VNAYRETGGFGKKHSLGFPKSVVLVGWGGKRRGGKAESLLIVYNSREREYYRLFESFGKVLFVEV